MTGDPQKVMTTCTTPISWLRLERYHLGELASTDHDAVAAHLASCKPCAALLARIAEDDRELPPLQLPTRAEQPVADPRSTASPKLEPASGRRPWYATRARAATIVSGLALAAIVLLAIGRKPSGEVAPGVRTKGGDVSFSLVREDEAVIAEAGGAYRDGERFKALVTCPPGMKARFDIAVFEHGDAGFPLPPTTDLPCGNAVPLPGAFRVTGRERMTVCLVWQDDGSIDREAIRRTPPGLLPHSLCKTLEPAP